MEKMTIIDDKPKYIICVKPIGTDSENEMPALINPQSPKSIFCVHRLDKTVGGVMIFAKTGDYASYLSKEIQDNKLIKEYFAVVSGIPDEKNGIMEDFLFKDSTRSKSFPVKRIRKGVKKASLEYKTLSTVETKNGPISLVKIKLHTGRFHQIRTQFASRKMPLLGDGKYGSREKGCDIALFSCALTFNPTKKSDSIRYSAIPKMTHPWNLFPVEIYK